MMYKTGLLLLLVCSAYSLLDAQCLAGNCQTGISKFRFQNGALYEGEMAYGKLNGTGT